MTPIFLAIDTSTEALSVAVGSAERGKFCLFQRRRRGHAEALVPMIDRALRAAGKRVADLNGVAVTVGPGTFTGVRIGLAAARGMRVATGIPVIGVNTLELLAYQAGRRWPDRPILAALDARRGQVYAQLFRRADPPWPEPWSGPFAASAHDAASMMPDQTIIIGGGAALIGQARDQNTKHVITDDLPDARALIDLVAVRPIASGHTPPPAPLYLRAADAIPAKPLLDL